MAINLDCKTVPERSELERLHHVPCKIDYDGPARVKKYFECNIRTSADDKGLEASYRGRPLHGEQKTVPSGYTGVVLKESHKVYDEEEERQFSIVHTFDRYTYWNLDNPPTDNDKQASALQWLDIANVLHEPVEDKENDTP